MEVQFADFCDLYPTKCENPFQVKTFWLLMFNYHTCEANYISTGCQLIVITKVAINL